MGKSRQGNGNSIPGGRNGMEKALWCKVQSVIMVVVLAWQGVGWGGLQRQMSGSHPTQTGKTGVQFTPWRIMLEASVQELEVGKEGGRGKNEAGNHGVLQVGSGEDLLN